MSVDVDGKIWILLADGTDELGGCGRFEDLSSEAVSNCPIKNIPGKCFGRIV